MRVPPITFQYKTDSEYHRPWVTIALSTTAEKIDLFERILSDLKGQTHQDFELLVVIQSLNNIAIERMETIVGRASLPFNVTFIVSDQRGLLRSRNTALRNARGRYILLADDDCRYLPSSVGTIKEKTQAFPDSEILTFQAETPNSVLLNPRNTALIDHRHSVRTVMSVCSIEIVVKHSLVKRTKELFDERFGLGTPFNTGGENIMLVDSLRKGVTITRHPVVIVQHPALSSGTGTRGLYQLAFAKGAMFRRMFGIVGFVFLMLFLLRRTLSARPPRFGPWHFWHAIAGFLKAPVGHKVLGRE